MSEEAIRLEAMKAAIQLVCCLSGSGSSPGEIAQNLGLDPDPQEDDIEAELDIMDILRHLQEAIVASVLG